jgi:hypothetical protein
MVRRLIRLFVTLILSLLTAPLATQAQPLAHVPRIGYLVTGGLDSPETRVLLNAFRQGLRERGYVEGQNIVIEYRAADGQLERFPALAAALHNKVMFRETCCAESPLAQ